MIKGAKFVLNTELRQKMNSTACAAWNTQAWEYTHAHSAFNIITFCCRSDRLLSDLYYIPEIHFLKGERNREESEGREQRGKAGWARQGTSCLYHLICLCSKDQRDLNQMLQTQDIFSLIQAGLGNYHYYLSITTKWNFIISVVSMKSALILACVCLCAYVWVSLLTMKARDSFQSESIVH